MNQKYSINDCQIITLDKISRAEGNLTVIESERQIPFCIKRVYYLYDIPADSERGGHAHKELSQLLIAVSGSFDIHIDDGRQKKTISLNKPNIGLLLTPMIWRVIDNFSSGAVCLALASELYKESDYYRNYADFIEAVNSDSK